MAFAVNCLGTITADIFLFYDTDCNYVTQNLLNIFIEVDWCYDVINNFLCNESWQQMNMKDEFFPVLKCIRMAKDYEICLR